MFYLLEISNTKKGIAKAITEKNSLTEGEMVFHQTLASAMANADVNSILVYLIDAKGSALMTKYWERKETPTEAVPTEE